MRRYVDWLGLFDGRNSQEYRCFLITLSVYVLVSLVPGKCGCMDLFSRPEGCIQRVLAEGSSIKGTGLICVCVILEFVNFLALFFLFS